MTDLTYAIVAGDATAEIEPLMTIREVCEWLGICDTTLMRLRREKKLEPTIDDSGLVRYLPADVRAYLAREKEAARQAMAQKQARRLIGAGLKSEDSEVAALPTPK
ncbi:MAG: helix-turn-helix domain-containing protein [Holophagaceae bacterium]|nr:helix-turn-helix domain-containing protein [Holophagaceae bacterium]